MNIAEELASQEGRALEHPGCEAWRKENTILLFVESYLEIITWTRTEQHGASSNPYYMLSITICFLPY
jgi:hypothetical protein